MLLKPILNLVMNLRISVLKALKTKGCLITILFLLDCGHGQGEISRGLSGAKMGG